MEEITLSLVVCITAADNQLRSWGYSITVAVEGLILVIKMEGVHVMVLHDKHFNIQPTVLDVQQVSCASNTWVPWITTYVLPAMQLQEVLKAAISIGANIL